jgi:hypothetical protein
VTVELVFGCLEECFRELIADIRLLLLDLSSTLSIVGHQLQTLNFFYKSFKLPLRLVRFWTEIATGVVLPKKYIRSLISEFEGFKNFPKIQVYLLVLE